jgi:hypothetical protein
LRQVENITFLVRERIEPTATLMNDNDDLALPAPIFDCLARALLSIQRPSVPFQKDATINSLFQLLDFPI